MNYTNGSHNWLSEETKAILAAVTIELHNLDALMYEVDHAECICEDCMKIVSASIDQLSEMANAYRKKWKNIEAHKVKVK